MDTLTYLSALEGCAKQWREEADIQNASQQRHQPYKTQNEADHDAIGGNQVDPNADKRQANDSPQEAASAARQKSDKAHNCVPFIQMRWKDTLLKRRSSENDMATRSSSFHHPVSPYQG
jgi:hypothetical protein